MKALSVLFIKETFICAVTAVASDGSSPSMALSAAVHCLLTSLGGWQSIIITPTNPDQ